MRWFFPVRMHRSAARVRWIPGGGELDREFLRLEEVPEGEGSLIVHEELW